MGDHEPSYIERALKSYIDNKFVSGFRVLFQKQYLPFSLILFAVLGVNITGLILYVQGISWMTLELMQDLLIAGFLIAVGMIICSLVSAVWKKYTFQWIVVYSGVIASILVAVLFDPQISDIAIQVIKLCFILIWTFVAVISTYFAIFYLFTGISGKILVAGKSDDHIFMGWLIRVVALGTLGLSIYIIYVNFGTTNAMIVAGLGVLCSLGLLIYSWAAPLDKTSTNFISILGVFNFYITYQLSASIEPAVDNKETNIITEIALFIFTALYYIQSKVRSIDNIETERLDNKEKKRKVFFQNKVIISEYSKKIFGELALVIMTIGIALGYSLVLLSLFLDTALPLSDVIGPLANIGIPLAGHRLSAIIAMLIFLVSFISFQLSEDFRDFATNKYTFAHGVKVLGDKVGAVGRRFKTRYRKRKERKQKEKANEESK